MRGESILAVIPRCPIDMYGASRIDRLIEREIRAPAFWRSLILYTVTRIARSLTTFVLFLPFAGSDGCGSTGAWPYNRPCAQQYVGKSQSCMVISGRLIVYAPVDCCCCCCCCCHRAALTAPMASPSQSDHAFAPASARVLMRRRRPAHQCRVSSARPYRGGGLCAIQ